MGKANLFIETVLGFVKRDLKVRYKDSFLGQIWIILYPLLFTLISSSIFSMVFKDTINNTPYFLYVLIGTIVWGYFSQALVSATRCLIRNRELLSNLVFSWSSIIIGSVFTKLFDFLINTLFFFVMLIIFGKGIGIAILFLPIIIIIQTLLILGISFITATLNVYFRDMQNILDILLQLIYFSAPIIFPLSIVPNNFKWIVYLNPITYLIDLYRKIIFNGYVDFKELLLLFLGTFLIFLLGYFTYNKHKDNFPELI